MDKIKIALIDVIGLTYDPTTIEKFGLGGSESAIIFMAKELNTVGFDVTVFNNCVDSRATPGVYGGVEYVDLKTLHEPNTYTCDVMVVSRTVAPFVDPTQMFAQLKQSASLKVLWMHDTFCDGDNLVEDLVVSGEIDEIFTLSDFHTSYVANCHHGPKRRNFEVLKNKIFMTRNGAKKYIDEVDIQAKDPNMFIYNASVTKGMLPLVEHIWPQVKRAIPEAVLTIIGGYYRFRDGAAPDAQEATLQKLVERTDLAELGITFTGVIPQREIADHLAKASFMIFPCAFPETFGISSLESMLYNTPLITTRFGALEETAVDLASYKIDYAIEPNGLFPHISQPDQVQRFVDTVIAAYRTPYLLQQKQQYCNIVHDIAGWDTVALQWKQHIYAKLGKYLPVDDYRAVMKINQRVHEVYGRRFSNPEEWASRYTTGQQAIIVISPFYNSAAYIGDCIRSVASQDYTHYRHILVDDASTDNGYDIALQTIAELPEHLQQNFEVIKNVDNRGSVFNYMSQIREAHRGSIIMLLDGDDALMPRNDILQKYNTLYAEGAEFTYGSMWSMIDNIPLVAQHYPSHVKKARSYRQYRFAWNMPYTHLRTFSAHLLKDVEDSHFMDENGEWLRAGGDTAIFYAGIERVDPQNIRVVTDIVYRYNDKNPLNDYKVNGDEQTRNANYVLGTAPEEVLMKKVATVSHPSSANKIKILIGIPTAKYIESECFKSIYDLDVPDNVEITFQYFYGYQIDQVRNLIAKWAEQYDYLFSVDSDIVLPKDALVKMLGHGVDVVSGVYVQRLNNDTIEIYRDNMFGGVSRIPLWHLQPPGLHEIAACGFGCALVKSSVITQMGYPQFVYTSALDHKDTSSEDTYFCAKARGIGARIFVDSTILCDHLGTTRYISQPVSPALVDELTELRRVSQLDSLPVAHKDYLASMKADGCAPKVIYDIGANVLHWARAVKSVWPQTPIIAFEAMNEVEPLYIEARIPYHLGVLSDTAKIVDFYQNTTFSAGNSYYRESGEFGTNADQIFAEGNIIKKQTASLDDVVAQYNFPLPDLIKMDVQGAELDVLKGAQKTLQSCNDLILELQEKQYNLGAPLAPVVIEYLKTQGFTLVMKFTSHSDVDGDYHFTRMKGR